MKTISNESKVILLCSDKGGVGKSTTSYTTAVSLINKRPVEDVVTVDFDINNQLNEFFQIRKENKGDEGIFNCNYFHLNNVYKNTPEDMLRFIDDLKKEHKVIIVDCAGKDSSSLRVLSQIADLIIVPTSASSNDLKQTKKFLDNLNDNVTKNNYLKEYKRKIKILINNVKKYSFKEQIKVSKKVRTNLNIHDNDLYFETIVANRQDYEDSLFTGITAPEINKKAKIEIDKLIEEIEEIIN